MDDGHTTKNGAQASKNAATTKNELDARGIRTPNLGVWNPTRCRCAIASRNKLAASRQPRI